MRPAIALVVPGALDQRTGGYLYDRRIVEGLRQRGRTVKVFELDGTFPIADHDALEGAEEVARTLRRSACLPLIDGLALPAFAPLLDLLPRSWVALVHHPLDLETGLAPEVAAHLEASERRCLAAATHIVVTSPQTARDLRTRGVAPGRVEVVLPGTEPAVRSSGVDAPSPRLLSVGALIPRKGHRVLIEALGGLRDLCWELDLVGSEARDPACARAIRDAVGRTGLEGRVRFRGELGPNALEAAYAAAAFVVQPSHHEGYGMALAEALARGLPVISTRAGAIPDTVPATAGILVEPGDADGLRDALHILLADPVRRRQLGEGAWSAGRQLPDWSTAAARFDQLLEAVLDRAGEPARG